MSNKGFLSSIYLFKIGLKLSILTPPTKNLVLLGLKTVSNSSRIIDSKRFWLSLLFIISLVLMLKKG